jgi:hypothetical protein
MPVPISANGPNGQLQRNMKQMTFRLCSIRLNHIDLCKHAHRNKLELVSRMVLSPNEYSSIKDRVAVAEAAESVKIGVGESAEELASGSLTPPIGAIPRF